MSDDVLKGIVLAQRRRAIAAILGHCDEHLSLTPDQTRELRITVRSAVSVLGDFTLDCIRSANQGSWVNEEAIKLFDILNDRLGRLLEDSDDDA